MTCCADDLPADAGIDAIPLDTSMFPWLIHEAHRRRIRLSAVVRAETGWAQASLSNMLLRAEEGMKLWIAQTPGCGGIVSRAVLSRDGVIVGAVCAERRPGEPEPDEWRVILLTALAEAARTPLLLAAK